ncbi:mechanosensitive ion channel family protein [Desulfolutivibrio sulfoxidireducens]|uniref:mechanosensitive ion channel family protein n=1 Tax=Desulfolutivibrio sulfoxidireducens TaxID=2773299 RepID=UPI00159DD3A0|nr:mechanosensitive ion channel family protein [Desulfolutivibrio sulfoxidireducens]QLA16391.1 mechanosensitive ion channel [Desulfolutivibrio sulfoxidireducens]
MKRTLATAVLVLVVSLSLALGQTASGASPTGFPGKAQKKESGAETPPLEDTTPDARLATMTDAQARRLLREKLAAEAGAAGAAEAPQGQEPVALFTLFTDLESGIRGFAARAGGLFDSARTELSDTDGLTNRLTDGRGTGHLAMFLAKLGLVLAVCLWAARMSQQLVGPWLRDDRKGRDPARFRRLLTFLLHACLRAVAAVVFYAAGFILVLTVFPSHGPEHGMAVIVVVAATYFLLIRVLALCILSPDIASRRPVPLPDAQARTLYGWLMAIAYGGLVCAVGSAVLDQVALAPALSRVAHAGAGVFTGGLLAAMILSNRRRVSRAIRDADPSGGENAPRAIMARFWHIPALAYALLIGLYWTAQDLIAEISILRLILSLFLIPACIGLDLWVRRILIIASGEDQQVIPLSAEGPAPGSDADGHTALPGAPAKKTIRHYLPLIKKTLRSALIILPAFVMLRLWGVDIPLGWLFARNVASIVLVVVAGLLMWEIIRIRIDRKLKEEMSLTGEEMEEGGGAGGSRSATLLLLLRKFLLCVIVVMGGLVVLSSLGVDIGPLIAGAGVVGLAIGFGAQTLVKDIISGVFFLVDDAFRVGDYVEAGTAKGTVEQISLRSMKLRHPRGMVFTIPYGGLKIIQNFSRDYIISKLDFRVKYDADIDKIRKIIKRINKELMNNEELRPGMLSDIKSMGVRKMEDSAMILRIKFKTIPGHQFLVQKELYRRIQEAFREHNIDFAHRNVTVYFPPEVQALVGSGGAASSEAVRAAVSGAAAGALAVEREMEEAAAREEKSSSE